MGLKQGTHCESLFLQVDVEEVGAVRLDKFLPAVLGGWETFPLEEERGGAFSVTVVEHRLHFEFLERALAPHGLLFFA